jgi:EF hand
LLDLVNIKEICRQTGLDDGNDLAAEIDVGRLRSICRKMYMQLNQRLTTDHLVDIDQSTEWLLYWLLTAYDTVGTGSIRIFALKMALTVLSKGKLEDKMTCKSNGPLRQFFFKVGNTPPFVFFKKKFEIWQYSPLCLFRFFFESWQYSPLCLFQKKI